MFVSLVRTVSKSSRCLLKWADGFPALKSFCSNQRNRPIMTTSTVPQLCNTTNGALLFHHQRNSLSVICLKYDERSLVKLISTVNEFDINWGSCRSLLVKLWTTFWYKWLAFIKYVGRSAFILLPVKLCCSPKTQLQFRT